MFFVMDKDTCETIATTRFEYVAEQIAKTFGAENCIIRYTPIGSTNIKTVFITKNEG